jgi:hypothetical protein
MTNEEFDNYKFGVNTRVLYRGAEYKLISVDFEIKTLGILAYSDTYIDIPCKEITKIWEEEQVEAPKEIKYNWAL